MYAFNVCVCVFVSYKSQSFSLEDLSVKVNTGKLFTPCTVKGSNKFENNELSVKYSCTVLKVSLLRTLSKVSVFRFCTCCLAKLAIDLR